MDFHAQRIAMVDSQIRANDVTDSGVLAAFATVRREAFVPEALVPVAYAERPLQTAPGRHMLTARDLAKLMQAAEIAPGDRVLDVAPGLGYSTALLARLAGSVVALETDAGRADVLRQRLQSAGVAAEIVIGELPRGAPDKAPFDVILVNGALESIPETWLGQLADGGRCVAIVSNRSGSHATIIKRSAGTTASRTPFDAQAPLLEELAHAHVFRF